MNMDIIIVIGIVVVGYIVFMIYSHQQSKASEQKKKRAGKMLSTEPPQTNIRGKTAHQQSASKLMRKVKENGFERFDEVTLIIEGQILRNEFLGSVDIIKGHQPNPGNYNKYQALKSWTFIGDPGKSDDAFKTEVQSILTELYNDGWYLEQVADEGRKEIWLMSR